MVETKTLTIAFIGLGSMGLGMAKKLVKHGEVNAFVLATKVPITHTSV